MNASISFCLAAAQCHLSGISELEMTNLDTQRIYFLRHAESEMNAFNMPRRKKGEPLLIGGQNPTSPLTTRGQEQATALGRMLAKKFTKMGKISVLSSTTVRTNATAQCIFQQLEEEGFDVERSNMCYEGLSEICEGREEGQWETEAFQQAKKYWEEKLSAKDKFFISSLPYDDKAESYSQVVDRAFRDLKTILAKHRNETLIIVSHTVTLNALALQWSQQVNNLSEELSTQLPKMILHNCDMLMVEIPVDVEIQQAQVKMQIHSGI